jgi:glutaredoxin
MQTDSNATHRAASKVVLYTRKGCHLCDEAHDLLIAHGLAPECIDVDDHPALRERFDECVPVVEIDGKIRFRGHIDPILLRRLLEGAVLTNPAPSSLAD